MPANAGHFLYLLRCPIMFNDRRQTGLFSNNEKSKNSATFCPFVKLLFYIWELLFISMFN